MVMYVSSFLFFGVKSLGGIGLSTDRRLKLEIEKIGTRNGEARVLAPASMAVD